MKHKLLTAGLFFFCGYLNAQSVSNDSTISPAMISVADMMKKLPGPKGEPFAAGIQHGSLQVLIYAPKGKDDQKPHKKDEVYVVVSGTGSFFDGKTNKPFKAGDVLFVPANAEHRFENFSGDFVTWVIFYGPQGGEK